MQILIDEENKLQQAYKELEKIELKHQKKKKGLKILEKEAVHTNKSLIKIQNKIRKYTKKTNNKQNQE